MSDARDKPRSDGLVAVGAYLRVLREGADLTVAEVSAVIGIDPAQIWRVERGYTDTKGSTLFAFIAVVKGDPGDVALLINNPGATPDDGQTLARLRRSLLR
jgi:transcriptional regulator with XRE-family HTH domain